MNIYIDTEFNEFQGELISMALVSESGEEFYEVLPCANPGPWVAENVMPILGQQAIPKESLQVKLQHWLSQFARVHLVADWPEDIQHFCAMLITGPGMRLNTPSLSMEIRRDLDAHSELPHNALADARAIRALAMNLRGDGPLRSSRAVCAHIQASEGFASIARAADIASDNAKGNDHDQ